MMIPFSEYKPDLQITMSSWFSNAWWHDQVVYLPMVQPLKASVASHGTPPCLLQLCPGVDAIFLQVRIWAADAVRQSYTMCKQIYVCIWTYIL